MRWQRLESEAADAIRSTPSGMKKYLLLHRFFDDVRDQLAEVIGLYFPKLLHVATTNRHTLGNQYPLGWTRAQVFGQVCDFLGVEEVFMEDSPPRDDSRVLRSAVQISTATTWFEDDFAPASYLPAWVESRWGLSRVLSMKDRDRELSASDLEALSLVETQNWVRAKEFWIHQRLECQIQDDSFEGVIHAGMTGISVLDPFRAETQDNSRVNEPQADVHHAENLFRRDGCTWMIQFDGESCRLNEMRGLDYIAILLERPMRAVGAQELMSIAGGCPVFPDRLSQVRASLEEDSIGSSDSEDGPATDQLCFGRESVLDATALRQIKSRSIDLDKEIAHRKSIGDSEGAAELEDERSEIQRHLQHSLNVRGRPRTFADEAEKARQSATQAITRALRKIRAQSPKTANHLNQQIERGSKFVYRDGTAEWRVTRKP